MLFLRRLDATTRERQQDRLRNSGAHPLIDVKPRAVPWRQAREALKLALRVRDVLIRWGLAAARKLGRDFRRNLVAHSAEINDGLEAWRQVNFRRLLALAVFIDAKCGSRCALTALPGSVFRFALRLCYAPLDERCWDHNYCNEPREDERKPHVNQKWRVRLRVEKALDCCCRQWR